MAQTKKMSPAAYFAALQAASDANAAQELVFGSVYTDPDAIQKAHEALLVKTEEASDNRDYAAAAAACRQDLVLAWALGDNRLLENASTQAVYYGTLAGIDALLENFATAWAAWAHVFPRLKLRDRSRLQDFARFRRSIELGVREREESDARINAVVGRLASAFDKLGALNVRAINDKSADMTQPLAALWQEAAELLKQMETSR